MTDQIECPDCEGEGSVENPHLSAFQLISPVSFPVWINCEACGGEGWRAPTDDERATMAESQAEDRAGGEPPVTMQEQYLDAWQLKQALRS